MRHTEPRGVSRRAAGRACGAVDEHVGTASIVGKDQAPGGHCRRGLRRGVHRQASAQACRRRRLHRTDQPQQLLRLSAAPPGGCRRQHPSRRCGEPAAAVPAGRFRSRCRSAEDRRGFEDGARDRRSRPRNYGHPLRSAGGRPRTGRRPEPNSRARRPCAGDEGRPRRVPDPESLPRLSRGGRHDSGSPAQATAAHLRRRRRRVHRRSRRSARCRS